MSFVLRVSGFGFDNSGSSQYNQSQVFDNPMFITVIDEEHSVDKERYITVGLSKRGRLLMVAHTDREGRIRIISARKATKKEEQFYAEAE